MITQTGQIKPVGWRYNTLAVVHYGQRNFYNRSSAVAVIVIIAGTCSLLPKLYRQGIKTGRRVENKKYAAEQEKAVALRKKTGQLVADRLEELGYYKYATPGDVPALKKVMAGYYFPDGGLQSEWAQGTVAKDYRLHFCDGEDLFELGGFTNLIAEMQPSFEKRNFRFRVSEDKEQLDDGNRYTHTITVNGTEYTVFKGFREDAASGWGLAALRLAEIINAELGRQRQEDRVYLISGGEEGQLVLLTEEQYQYTCSVFSSPKHRPLPPEQWAWEMKVLGEYN